MPFKKILNKIYKKILNWLHLTNEPIVKVYNGYGTRQHVYVFGHVFKFSPVPRTRYRKLFLTNTFALLRSFMVKPWTGATVKLVLNKKSLYATTESDGFFKFEWQPDVPLTEGWHTVQVHVLHPVTNKIIGAGDGNIFVPHLHQYAIISDIDDTFLVSHSSRLKRRLYVLLTKNAHSRKPFDDVVKHYQLLAKAGSLPGKPNPFFYVSSSEWNLYDFIVEFSLRNHLPRGIYLLAQLKKLHQVLATGQGKHSAKFVRIVRILEAFPNQRFILLGDDSQEDPNIYAAVVKHFTGRIEAVYIRKIHAPHESRTLEKIAFIKSMNISCCYFSHSSEAIIHGKSIGLLGSI